MANPLLGQILGGAFANAMRGRSHHGPFGRAGTGGMGGIGGMGGAGLGGLLAGMAGARMAGRRGLGGNQGMLLAMLLPFAMQWVQRNGGVGAVLERFRKKGFDQQAQSWVSTGQNAPVPVDAMDDVIGREEISQIAKQLGVPESEVAAAFADILPEMVDQLSPEGEVPAEADEALNGGLSQIEKAVKEIEVEKQGA